MSAYYMPVYIHVWFPFHIWRYKNHKKLINSDSVSQWGNANQSIENRNVTWDKELKEISLMLIILNLKMKRYNWFSCIYFKDIYEVKPGDNWIVSTNLNIILI